MYIESLLRFLGMEVDGGRVPTREGWREVKLGTIFEGQESKEGDIRGETRYFGAVHDELEEFVREWKAEAAGMGVKEGKEVIVIGDGADWIWNKVSEEFPKADRFWTFTMRWHTLGKWHVRDGEREVIEGKNG